ncbi:MAG TPA: hypothetical protein VFZ68_12030 [Acidimicrobiales bacterium]
MNELDPALRALDDRLGRASDSLRAAVTAALTATDASRSAIGTGPDGGEALDGQGERPAGGLPAPGRVSRSPRARVTLAAIAAAVLVVVGVALAFASSRGDDRAPVVTGGTGFLVPDSVPGFGIQQAERWPAGQQAPETATVAVYGELHPGEPWPPATLAVRLLGDDGEPAAERADEEIEIGGRRAFVSSRGAAIVVEVEVDGGGWAEVVGHGLDQRAVVAAAGATSGDGTIGADGLPGGFDEVVRLRVAAGTWLQALVRPGSVSLTYGGASSAHGVIGLIQQPATSPGSEAGPVEDPRTGPRDGPTAAATAIDAEVDIVRAMPGTPREVPVGDRRAVVTELDDPVAFPVADADVPPPVIMRWRDPSGTLVTLVGTDVTVDEVVAFAEALRPAHAGEIEDLLRRYGSSAPLGQLAEGETVVARGEVVGVRWRLVAADDGDMLTLSYQDERGATAVGQQKDAPVTGVVMSFATHAGAPQPGDEMGVFGLVPPGTERVAVESPVHEPFDLFVHTVDGWPGRVFVGWWTVGLKDADVIALGAGGEELARTASTGPPVP